MCLCNFRSIRAARSLGVTVSGFSWNSSWRQSNKTMKSPALIWRVYPITLNLLTLGIKKINFIIQRCGGYWLYHDLVGNLSLLVTSADKNGIVTLVMHLFPPHLITTAYF